MNCALRMNEIAPLCPAGQFTIADQIMPRSGISRAERRNSLGALFCNAPVFHFMPLF
jgi:hypothetical protein